MRGSRPGAPFARIGRGGTAWLSVLSLLLLLAIQPFHGPAAEARVHTGRAGAIAAARSHAAAHDAGTCQVCRAVSQVRSGLRGHVQQAAPHLALRPRELSAALVLHPAPDLRDAWPRGPPAPHSA